MKKKNLKGRIFSIVHFSIAAIVILLAFAIEQPCDIDSVYLWCRTHPTNFLDIFGAVLIGVSSIWTLVYWWNSEDSLEDRRWFEYIGVGLFLIGMVLMWIK